MSGIQLLDCSELAKNPKSDNDVTIFRNDVNVNFFWGCCVSLVKFSYWSKFHVNIMTSSGVMTIKCPVWVFSQYLETGARLIPNLARVSLMKCYWMLQNVRVTALPFTGLHRDKQPFSLCHISGEKLNSLIPTHFHSFLLLPCLPK